MIGRSSNLMQSHKVKGRLWLLAALPMIIGPALFGGIQAVAAVGLLFLILGITELRRK